MCWAFSVGVGSAVSIGTLKELSITIYHCYTENDLEYILLEVYDQDLTIYIFDKYRN